MGVCLHNRFKYNWFSIKTTCITLQIITNKVNSTVTVNGNFSLLIMNPNNYFSSHASSCQPKVTMHGCQLNIIIIGFIKIFKF